MKQDIELTQQEQDYIERCSDQIKANTVFHRVHEEGIVLSEMSFEECIAFLKDFDYASVSSICGTASLIRVYLEFIGINSSEWDKVNSSVARKIIDKRAVKNKYFTPVKVQEVINNLENPMDQFVILAIYEGFWGENGEEVYNLLISDIDKNAHTVNYGNGVVKKMSEGLYKIAVMSARTYEYTSETKYMELFDLDIRGAYVVKTVWRRGEDTPFTRHERIRKKIWTIGKKVDISPLNPSNLLTSGMLYEVKKIMLKYGCSSIEAVAKPEMDAVLKQYGMDSMSKKSLATKIKNNFV